MPYGTKFDHDLGYIPDTDAPPTPAPVAPVAPGDAWGRVRERRWSAALADPGSEAALAVAAAYRAESKSATARVEAVKLELAYLAARERADELTEAAEREAAVEAAAAAAREPRAAARAAAERAAQAATEAQRLAAEADAADERAAKLAKSAA